MMKPESPISQFFRTSGLGRWGLAVTVLLIDVDQRKPGIHREIRYEITAAELIAAIRAHGAELPGEQPNP